MNSLLGRVSTGSGSNLVSKSACNIRGFLDSGGWTGSLNLAMVDAEELQNNLQRHRAAMERIGKVSDQI